MTHTTILSEFRAAIGAADKENYDNWIKIAIEHADGNSGALETLNYLVAFRQATLDVYISLADVKKLAAKDTFNFAVADVIRKTKQMICSLNCGQARN